MEQIRFLEELIDEVETMESVEEVTQYLTDRLSEEIQRQETQDILRSMSEEEDITEEEQF